MVDININLEVTATLTDFGMEVFDKYISKSLHEYESKYGFDFKQTSNLKDIMESWIEKDTKVITVQFWRLISIFGDYINKSVDSNKPIFENDCIKINTRELSIYNDLKF
jgi:hypothetical protein